MFLHSTVMQSSPNSLQNYFLFCLFLLIYFEMGSLYVDQIGPWTHYPLAAASLVLNYRYSAVHVAQNCFPKNITWILHAHSPISLFHLCFWQKTIWKMCLCKSMVEVTQAWLCGYLWHFKELGLWWLATKEKFIHLFKCLSNMLIASLYNCKCLQSMWVDLTNVHETMNNTIKQVQSKPN
jgi:hypothetical protein